MNATTQVKGKVYRSGLLFRGAAYLLAIMGLVSGVALIPTNSYGQECLSWNRAGDYVVDVGTTKAHMAMMDSTPYVAFADPYNAYKVSVKKFDGTNWVFVGTPGFTPYTATPMIAIHNGVPYVAYSQMGTSKASVMKFNGTSWVLVGSAEFTPSNSNGVKIAISSSGTIFIAYVNSSGRLTVMKYNGTSWVLLGSEGFTNVGGNTHNLAVDGSGTPYVSFGDYNGPVTADYGKGSVMKFNGTSWEYVGSPFFSERMTANASFISSESGTLYMANSHFTPHPNVLKVWKYDGSSWTETSVGMKDINRNASLALDSNDVPYIAYEDLNSPLSDVTVRKFNGTYWEFIGLNPASAPYTYYASTTMCIGSNGAPWVLSHLGNTSKMQVYRLQPTAPTIGGTASVCNGNTTTLTNSYYGGVWSSTAPEVASVGTSGIVTGNSGGNAEISYQITPTCVASTTVTVNTYPTLMPIAGPTTVYTEEGTALSNSTPGGTWISSAPAVATISGTGVVTGVTPGTAKISYTVANGTCATTVTTNVTSVLSCLNWLSTSAEPLSPGIANVQGMVSDNSGNLYMAYKDQDNGNRAIVKKYDGTSWTIIGDDFATTNGVSDLQLAVDNAGKPYLFFCDVPSSGRGTVMSYNGTSWYVVGGEPVSAYQAAYPALAIDGSGMPWVVYNDVPASPTQYVKRFDGTNWVTVSMSFTPSSASFYSMAFNSTGTPYIAFADAGTTNGASVMSYNGSTWSLVGSRGIAAGAGAAEDVTIKLDNTGTPYVGFIDGSASNGYSVRKYNGSSWEGVGSNGFVQPLKPAMILDANGKPIVSYADLSADEKLTVKKFDGSNWVTLGNASFTGSAVNQRPAIAMSNGTLYAAFSRISSMFYKAEVYKYGHGGSYTITSSAGAHGSISPNGNSTLCEGSTQVYTITPASGYHVLDVTLDGSSVGAVTTYTLSAIAAAHTVNATFEENCDPVTITSAAAVTNVNCYGATTGRIVPNVSGSTPFTWAWSNGATTASLTNVPAGAYTYTVSNGCGSVTGTATISQPAAALTLSTTVTNVLCNGGSTGSVSVTATGGTSPYTGTGNFTGKAAGPYSYTVTDNKGCTSNVSGTITQPAAALVASKTITDVNCFGESNGSVLVSATGGTTPYTGTGNFTDLSAGSFSYTVTDNNGCTSVASGTVAQPTQFVSSKSVTNVLCFGNNTGSVTISGTGGTTPYTGTGTFGSLVAGTYTFAVTDAHGCVSNQSATVTQPAGGLVASSSVTNVSCFGGNTGSVVVSATGGTSPYTGTGNFTDKYAGPYSYTVTDNNGCTSTTSGTVGQPSQLVATKSVTNVRCNGENNGRVIVGATGGTSPYTGTGTFSGLSPAPYSYTVTDNKGCTSTVSGTITEPAVLVASNTPAIAVNSFNILCNKGVTGSTVVSATGGTTPYYNTGNHTGMDVGAYSFTVTDNNGCTASTSGSLTQAPPFYVSASTSDDTICNGESVTLSATGGAGAFLWGANNGISTTYSSAPVTATPSTGIPTVTVGYTVIGFNVYGCSSEPDTVDVTVLPIGYFTGYSAVCTDFSVDLDNGTPGGVWSTPDTTYTTLDQNGLVSAFHKVLGATYPGSIEITYTMPNGCYRTRTETIYPTPDTIYGPETVCPNSSIILTQTVWGGVWTTNNTSIATVAQVVPNAYNYGRTTGIIAGTAIVSYSMPGTGCYVTKTVTVEPLAAITGLTNTCVDNTIQLSHPKSGSLWSSSATAKATVNNASGLVTGVSTGSAIITYMVNPTCYVTHTVNVNTTPTPITGVAAVCENATTTLANTVAGGTWSSSSPATGS
ncbi:Ig-like domain-containing protein, partial [Nemorincola caseinilytica]|uniref:Ig-like domain-containing protein n=1 Tax=Nemorincola caseinilytica TaxID=2054315 RepID=UPI0031E84234